MADVYEICLNCREDDCDLCEDSWASPNGDEYFCICDCSRSDDDSLLVDVQSDVWNKYRDAYADLDDDKYYDS